MIKRKKKPSILGIIPARGGSKRFPRKNIARLNNKPLLQYAIETARRSGVFEKLVVSTEDREIARIAKKNKAVVDHRSRSLARDTSTVNQVCLDLVRRLEKKGETYDMVGIILPCVPLRTANDLKKALNLLLRSKAQGVMAVTTYEKKPFYALRKKRGGELTPLFSQRYFGKQSQALPETYKDNGSIYFVWTTAYKKYKDVYLPHLIGYSMPRERSVDIDTKTDFELAKFYLKK